MATWNGNWRAPTPSPSHVHWNVPGIIAHVSSVSASPWHVTGDWWLSPTTLFFDVANGIFQRLYLVAKIHK
jgi:hypothetical protein